MHDLSFRREDDMEEFISKYENKLYRTAIAIVGNKADAEDIVQDVFENSLRSAQFFNLWSMKLHGLSGAD